ncbi:Ras-related protein Rab-1A [Balamuthia mandrillaris]
MSTTSMNPDFDLVFKVLLIGDSGVGKSSILTRFTEDKFLENDAGTVGVDSKTKTLEVDDKRVKLNIWDTAGQERMGFLTSSYYRGAHGIIIVFDITNEESYRNVANWLGEIERYAFDSALKILIGNKSDLAGERQVQASTATEYAENELSTEYFEASAKTGDNISEAFLRLTQMMKKRKEPQQGQHTNPKPGGNTLNLGGTEPQPARRRRCQV